MSRTPLSAAHDPEPKTAPVAKAPPSLADAVELLERVLSVLAELPTLPRQVPDHVSEALHWARKASEAG